MNFSKKRRKIRTIERDSFIYGLYQIRKRNKAYLYTDMELCCILKKSNNTWKKEK